MKYQDMSGKLADYRRQIADIREKMRDAIATVEPQEVKDYEFANTDGSATQNITKRAISVQSRKRTEQRTTFTSRAQFHSGTYGL